MVNADFVLLYFFQNQSKLLPQVLISGPFSAVILLKLKSKYHKVLSAELSNQHMRPLHSLSVHLTCLFTPRGQGNASVGASFRCSPISKGGFCPIGRHRVFRPSLL